MLLALEAIRQPSSLRQNEREKKKYIFFLFPPSFSILLSCLNDQSHPFTTLTSLSFPHKSHRYGLEEENGDNTYTTRERVCGESPQEFLLSDLASLNLFWGELHDVR